jgi:hypothetical protein
VQRGEEGTGQRQSRKGKQRRQSHPTPAREERPQDEETNHLNWEGYRDPLYKQSLALARRLQAEADHSSSEGGVGD